MSVSRSPDANALRMLIEHERLLTELEKQVQRYGYELTFLTANIDTIHDLYQLVTETDKRQKELLDMILLLRERGERLQERVFDLEHNDR